MTAEKKPDREYYCQSRVGRDWGSSALAHTPELPRPTHKYSRDTTVLQLVSCATAAVLRLRGPGTDALRPPTLSRLGLTNHHCRRLARARRPPPLSLAVHLSRAPHRDSSAARSGYRRVVAPVPQP